jgi:glycine/D-amino acid oxidase-like deaminating enzyme
LANIKCDFLIIGGGILGIACAISLAKKTNYKKKIVLIEKKVICAGLSSRQSGLIRSANSSSLAALMASDATDMWINIEKYWGVTSNYLQTGAIWIGAKPNTLTELDPWKNISNNMKALNIDFEEIDSVGVKSLSNQDILTNENERYFYEPKAIQLDVSGLTESINDAIMLTNVDVYESTEINEISCGENEISHISTNKGIFESGKIVNAAGAWSKELFHSCGLTIPVTLEPVNVCKWLVGNSKLDSSTPIIADYINKAYFRRMQGSVIHMHQPRERITTKIASNFLENEKYISPNNIYDLEHLHLPQTTVDEYAQKIKKRFARIETPIFIGGYTSFFDITPDLNFILGSDDKIHNLIHCLGAGQALKYAPVFGEIIAEVAIYGESKRYNIDEFSIKRFNSSSLDHYFSSTNDNKNSPPSL